MARTLGYGLAILGAAVLLLYGGYYFVMGFVLNEEVPVVVRLGVAGVIVGVILVIASLVWERLRDKKQESFREVEK